MEEISWDPLPDPTFTCYKITFPSRSAPLEFDIKRRTMQDPEEMFDMRFSSQCNAQMGFQTFQYKLKFYNNLHEICKNYYYEIVLKALLFVDGYHQVRTLIATADKRNDGVIKGKGVYHLNTLSRELKHYILYICRYKDSKARECTKKEDSIGSMLWTTGAYSDISLIVGDKILRAHREVLSQKSDVFKKMFSHEMAESQNGIVKIDDLDNEVVEEMLSYIYTGRAGNIAKMPRELFEAAHKYQLHDLQSLCEEHFIFNLNYENVVDILEMVHLYDLEELEKGIKSFIEYNEEDMVEEPTYRSFLCRALKVKNAVDTILLADRNKLNDVKKEALKFIKEHDKEMMQRTEFLDLFKTQPDLIRSVFEYIYGKVDDELKSSD